MEREESRGRQVVDTAGHLGDVAHPLPHCLATDHLTQSELISQHQPHVWEGVRGESD